MAKAGATTKNTTRNHQNTHDTITASKRGHLVAAAQLYLAEVQRETGPYRIDVVAVQLDERGRLVAVRHYRSAVELEE